MKNPEYRIFIVDSVGNVRGSYPKQPMKLIQNNSTNFLLTNDDFKIDDLNKKIYFYFKMPPKIKKLLEIEKYLYISLIKIPKCLYLTMFLNLRFKKRNQISCL